METYANFIDGEWVPTQDASLNQNPSNIADIIGAYSNGRSRDAEHAISAARQAFPKWASTSPVKRFEILDRIGTELIDRQKELGRLLSREEGKTLAEGVNEFARAGAIFKYFAGEPLRSSGERLASARESVMIEVVREPVGVVALITPWNFPIAIPAWKAAPALAYGNCVVLKPAELVPGSAWALAEIISRSGMPSGVFNLIMGTGDEVGRALVESRDVSAVSFTGSTAVGNRIGRACFNRGARVQLEMGGKNPLIVLDDADLDTALDCTIQGAYMSTGQRCTASSRLIVEKGIHDCFVDALAKRVQALRVGDALAPDTEIGPVISEEQLQIDLKYLQLGKEEGATLLCGGERQEKSVKGYYLSPALFVDTRNEMRINREEIFGPIATIIKVEDREQAISIANDTDFGLSAGIITRDAKFGARFARLSQAGMVSVNISTAGMDFYAPFTGRRSSSYGPPERGSFARDFYTATKVIYAT